MSAKPPREKSPISTPRKTLRDKSIQPIGMFAVMRHKEDLKSAKFVSLHTTRESAVNEAQRLAGLTIDKYELGQEFIYYVITIVARVGFVDDKFENAV